MSYPKPQSRWLIWHVNSVLFDSWLPFDTSFRNLLTVKGPVPVSRSHSGQGCWSVLSCVCRCVSFERLLPLCLSDRTAQFKNHSWMHFPTSYLAWFCLEGMVVWSSMEVEHVLSECSFVPECSHVDIRGAAPLHSSMGEPRQVTLFWVLLRTWNDPSFTRLREYMWVQKVPATCYSLLAKS